MVKVLLKCETCHNTYERWPYEIEGSRFCSRSCQSKTTRNQIQTGYKRVCWYCGKDFYAPKCYDRNKARTQERVFCSHSCYKSYNRVELPCEQCGNTFVVQRHRKDIARFCKHACYAVWLSFHNAGENHPNWKGGWEPYYGSDWPRQRQACRERDNYTCRICQRTREQVSSENLDVHHHNAYRVSKDNSLGNLITLCDKCHHDVENNKIVCPVP